MTATKYVDLDGLSRFKSKCDDTYRTEAQVNSQIDTKLSTYQNNIVQIVSTKPTVSEAQQGILYLVVDSADSSGTVYTAYALENVDVSGTPTPTIVQVGSGTFTPETKDTVPTQNSTNPITSGAVYTALADKFDIADISTSITDGDTNPVDGNAVYDALALKVDTSSVTSSAPSNGSSDICTSGSVYTALQDYVTSASIASSVTSGDNNVVSADAVYDFFNDNIDTATNNDIDALFSSGSGGSGTGS